jgi:antitoxin MazE
MLATVSRWGNSLALRIPRGLAEDAQLVEGASVDLRVEDGRLVAEPVRSVSLDALLSRVTKGNLHDAQGDDAPTGREVW